MRRCSFHCLLFPLLLLTLAAEVRGLETITAGETPNLTTQQLQRAIDAANSGDVITLSEGTYELDAPLRVTRPITLRAQENAKVILSGGRKLSLQWSEVGQGVMQASLPENLDLDAVAFDQLYLDGNRLHLARYPNYSPEERFFGGTAADALSPERIKTWSNPTGGFIHSLHRSKWGGNHWRMLGKNNDGTLKLEGGWMNNRASGINPKLRFVENIREELDTPGEWFLDRANRILYIYPLTGTAISNAAVVASGLARVIEVVGDSSDAPADGFRLSGITIAHSSRTFMKTNEPLLRSDWMIHREGAVYLENASNATIEDCVFQALGGNAVFVSGYGEKITVKGCHLHDLGASGVCFVGRPEAVRSPSFAYGRSVALEKLEREPGPKTEDYPRDCLVEDCLIHDIGTTEKQTAGVQISMASRITVRHASIYDTPRAGINIGDGTWGGHRIESCDVFDTVQMTGDHGSFNSWGRDRFWHPKRGRMDQLVVEHPELILLDACETTVICNSRWRCDHGWDIDLDDGSSNYEIFNNLCLHGGLKLREGFHRHAYNNITINNSIHPHVWFETSHDILERNIVTTWYRPIRLSGWGKKVDYNLLPDAAALDRSRNLGLDTHGLSGNPLFIDAAAGDFRVKDGSPALALGFKNFAMDTFGVQKPAFRAIAREPVIPKLEFKTEVPIVRTQVVLGGVVKSLQGLGERSATGLDSERGLLVMKVPEGSVAQTAGLQPNDVILSVDGQPTNSPGQFQPRYLSTKANENCSITIFRNQGEHELKLPGLLTVRLGAESAKPAGNGHLPSYDVERNYLGRWTNKHAVLKWSFECHGEAEFEVFAELAGTDDAKGSTWSLTIGNETLHGITPNTGGWTNFKSISVGTIKLKANGNVLCLLKPTAMPGDAVMNLRAIELVRRR